MLGVCFPFLHILIIQRKGGHRGDCGSLGFHPTRNHASLNVCLASMRWRALFLKACPGFFIASRKKLAGPLERATALQNRVLKTSWRGGSYLGAFGAAGFGGGNSSCCSQGLISIFCICIYIYEGFSSVIKWTGEDVMPRYSFLPVAMTQLNHVSTDPVLLIGSYMSLRWYPVCGGVEKVPTVRAHVLEHVPTHLCVCMCYSSALPLH